MAEQSMEDRLPVILSITVSDPVACVWIVIRTVTQELQAAEYYNYKYCTRVSKLYMWPWCTSAVCINNTKDFQCRRKVLDTIHEECSAEGKFHFLQITWQLRNFYASYKCRQCQCNTETFLPVHEQYYMWNFSPAAHL